MPGTLLLMFSGDIYTLMQGTYLFLSLKRNNQALSMLYLYTLFLKL